ncbi:unnamed protein product, partial [Ectocarpus sp. 4 AP-2014]
MAVYHCLFLVPSATRIGATSTSIFVECFGAVRDRIFPNLLAIGIFREVFGMMYGSSVFRIFGPWPISQYGLQCFLFSPVNNDANAGIRKKRTTGVPHGEGWGRE